MKKEKGAIAFGKRNIEFLVRRSKKRKTVSIFVDPVEGVFLRAPYGLPFDSLAKLVHKKAIWILDKQRRINEALEYIPKREFVTGESLFYLGRRLRLKILKCGHKPKISVKDGRFVVSLNGKTNSPGKIKFIRDFLIHWYKKHAKTVLGKRTKIYSKKLEVSTSEVILANQSKRWGSCNQNGRIRFNWHVIMAPMPLVDYVVAHELCHLKYINHSEKFWKHLGTIMPDYELRRERLRREGMRFYF